MILDFDGLSFRKFHSCLLIPKFYSDANEIILTLSTDELFILFFIRAVH